MKSANLPDITINTLITRNITSARDICYVGFHWLIEYNWFLHDITRIAGVVTGQEGARNKTSPAWPAPQSSFKGTGTYVTCAKSVRCVVFRHSDSLASS